jgi:glycosyltransferase involved in cell wall biosynthesis
MSSYEYPRLLVVTANAFGQQTGTGISLTNLFKGWPRDKVANLHREYAAPDRTVCDRFFYLSEEEMPWHPSIARLAGAVRWLRGVSQKNAATGGAQAVSPEPRQTTDETRAPQLPLSRLLPQRVVDRLVVGGIVDCRTEAELTDELRAWMDDFRPQVVYSNLGDLGFLKLVRLIAERYQIPTAVQMSDDWPNGRYRSVFSRWLRARMESELRLALARARLRFGICDAMCRAYEKRYGVPFRTCISPVETEDWLEQAKNEWSYSGSFRVVYMGTVHPLAQLTSLMDAGRAISEMRLDGTQIRLEILTPQMFTADLRRTFRGLPAVQVNDSPASSQAASVLASADLLLIPANFDRASLRYIRYSLPAKSIAYMVSSCPVLVYGPPNIPPVEYARNEGWGFVVDTPSPSKLKQAMATLMRDEALRKSLGLRGREVAVRNHDGKRLRAWLHDLLCRAGAGDVGLDRVHAER